MSNFLIEVAGKGVKKHQMTSIHIMTGLLLSVLGIITWAVPDSIKSERFHFLNLIGISYLLFGIVLIFIAIFFNKRIIQNPRHNMLLRSVELFLVLPIVIYSLIQEWYLPAAWGVAGLTAVVVALYFESSSQKVKTVNITEQGIVLPLVGKTTVLQWQAIKKIIIKHNILTIDCRNNKLYQFYIKKTIPNSKEHENLMIFSTLMIKKNEHLYQDDW